MSIRFKILFGCLCLTMVTVLLGSFSQRSQQNLGSIATHIYDDTVIAISYLRSAQNGLMKLRVNEANARRDEAEGLRPDAAIDAENTRASAVADILSDLGIAHERAMSPAGAQAVAELTEQVRTLGAGANAFSFSGHLAHLEDIQAKFDTTVEIFAGDGFRFRHSVDANIEQSIRQTWIVTGLSVLIALLITYLLSRSIVPALHDAVRIAKAIAAGELDNAIDTGRTGETGQMMRALAIMQTSIGESLDKIRSLLAQQATSHADEVAVQNTRFQAALDNMVQGLCLFDASHRLIVFNRRFAEMFGTPGEASEAGGDIAAGTLQRMLERGDTGSVFEELADGRTIALAHQPTSDGGWVVTYEDVTERRKSEAKFLHMARHDSLTELPNRVLFREHIEDIVARGRLGRGLAVLILDLDGFKAVNDNFGHPMGDALLKAVARRLSVGTRGCGLVARLGGDEFAVVQEGVLETGAMAALATRLLQAMETPFEIEAQHLVISASIGIATAADVVEDHGASLADDLLKRADLALYKAKGDGRGVYRFFETEMNEELHERRSLERDMQRALETGQFEVFYQPLVDTEQGEIIVFEALLRWRHPKRGMVSPAIFIPIAEEIGMIKAIGAWVLEEACREAATWPDGIKVAVNLSAVQFRNADLVAVVSRALILSGLAATRLELEITESVLLKDNGTVLTTLHRLRQLGIGIAMDDFGTGYSSLSYLQRFPFDKIKIDQSFVRELTQKQNAVAIVRTVIGLGRSLGVAVVAEGVETAEQLAILQRKGCWNIQGYLFSRPRPAFELSGLIAEIRAMPRAEKENAETSGLVSAPAALPALTQSASPSGLSKQADDPSTSYRQAVAG